jgi:penicillin G amidase
MKGHRACFRASLAALAVGAVLLTGGCVILPRMAFPKTRGEVRLKDLQAPVEVLRDRYGVPHIYARSAKDLFFAQGYVHAQDRFWQMEFSRRAGAGRLSELFGKKLLETDIFLRTLGFTQVAREEYRLMDDESRGYLDSYVAGVNAYIRDRKPGRIALEYSLLKLIGTDFEVEEWKPEHSLTWAKMMSQTLSANMDVERLIFELLRTAGLSGTTGFFAPYREDMPYIISKEELGGRGALVPAPAGDLAARFGLELFHGGGNDGMGTNSWVISGKLTATGKPILANDTHLGIQMPSIWYEVGLHQTDADGKQLDSAGAFQVRGFSFPGFPGVVIGHNSRIAWGVGDFTDDVQDFYLERINPENPNQYEVNGTWKDMQLVHERIDIQGVKEPFVHVVRRTGHGPIITDRGGYKALESYGFSASGVFPSNLELSAISLQWTAFQPGELLKSILALDRARGFQEFRDALRFWDGPVQNITYADLEGNIGYQAAGRVPIRSVGQGLIPVPGWTGAYEWKGFIPFDELPSLSNPPKGYIVAANNPAASSEFPYYLGSQGTYGYRARRIAELIEGDKDKVSVDDVKAMQADTYDLAAIEIRKHLEGLDLTLKETSEYLKEKEPLGKKDRRKRAETEKRVAELLEPARERLLAWDGKMDRKSGAAAIYGFFFLELIEETFRDQYPAERWNQIGHERAQNSLYYLLQEPENQWWDDARSPDVRETRDTILVRSFRQAVEDCIDRMGGKIDTWEWGRIHQAEFRSSTLGESGIGFIERIFNRGPIATSGGSATVNVSRWKLEDPFKVVHIPAMREIIDLGDIGSGWMMHAPGQSGHPGNRHYDDFIGPWRDVEYHPTLWDRADVESNRKGRLVLEPAR